MRLRGIRLTAGGGTSVGGPFSLTGTIGQADAGVVSADNFVLSGGFWAGSFGCIVNLTDLSIVAEHWMDAGPSVFDLDGIDGIKMGDFAELSYWWYDACPADWPLK